MLGLALNHLAAASCTQLGPLWQQHKLLTLSYSHLGPPYYRLVHHAVLFLRVQRSPRRTITTAAAAAWKPSALAKQPVLLSLVVVLLCSAGWLVARPDCYWAEAGLHLQPDHQ